MNLPIQNLENWELHQAIVAVNQAQNHQIDFIRALLRRHRFKVARAAIELGSKINPEFMQEGFHPLVGAQSADADAVLPPVKWGSRSSPLRNEVRNDGRNESEK